MPEYYNNGVNPVWPYRAIYGPPPGPPGPQACPPTFTEQRMKKEIDRSAWRCAWKMIKWSVVLFASVLWAIVLVAVHQEPSLTAPVALGAFAAWRLRVWSRRRPMYQKIRS